MIDVLVADEDRESAAEFFQLFKTPWRDSAGGAAGPVLLSTRPQVPRTGAKLVLLFHAGKTSWDEELGISPIAIGPRGTIVRDGPRRYPLYGAVSLLRGDGTPLMSAADGPDPLILRMQRGECTVIRAGFDLFAQVRRLISEGQPPHFAAAPTLDWLVALLRHWIITEGIPLAEIPPVPPGHRFFVCLTHDVDFLWIRRHRFDHTLAGFLYRASIGSLLDAARGRRSWRHALKNLGAVLRLPWIHLGLARDYWDDFEAYRNIEGSHPSTFFIIPFKHRAGEKVNLPHAKRRAAPYDIGDLGDRLAFLDREGCEIGLHGIDAWHCPEAAKREAERIRRYTGRRRLGVRMHWLCYDGKSPAILEQAGIDYDASFGYNETVGYRAGTGQPFRPPGAQHLLELPLHIQDVALFLPQVAPTPQQAWERCREMVEHAQKHGGVLTLLWHTRSLSPERFWGDFYRDVILLCQRHHACFADAQTVIDWFRLRRAARLQETCSAGGEVEARIVDLAPEQASRLVLRLHSPCRSQNDGTAVRSTAESLSGGEPPSIDSSKKAI